MLIKKLFGLLTLLLACNTGLAVDIIWQSDRQHPDAFVLSNFKFPENFQWGAATSAYQIEGAATADGEFCENNWTRDTKKVHPGVACDHWNRYKEDVQLIKQAGLNAYRLSIEWSKVEPKHGVFDERAMAHYVDLCDELIINGITPIVCLFHHTWPTWFDDKDAFEREQNCDDFVQFADYVFEHLGKKITFWMTFNEPVGFVMEGYLTGRYPPYRGFNELGLLNFKQILQRPGIVLKNMLNTHVRIYQRFKKNNPVVQIGFPKVMHPLEPYHPWNPTERMLCAFFSYLLHDVTINFFKTGLYNWAYAVGGYNALAPQSLDYLGVNYYTHTLMCQKLTGGICLASRPDELLAENGKAVYPTGLAWSIEKAATVGVPLYITENGIATNNDELRDTYMKQHLYEMCKKIDEGIDIRGYHAWALMDTYGWRKGFKDAGYGLYAVDFAGGTLARTLRPGVYNFVEFVKQQTL